MGRRLLLVALLVIGVIATITVSTAVALRTDKGTVLRIRADPAALKYNVSKLRARAGRITIVMSNPSPMLHDIAIKGQKTKGKTVGKGGVSKLTVTLKPGRYAFYCTVPGHAAAVMKGILVVR